MKLYLYNKLFIEFSKKCVHNNNHDYIDIYLNEKKKYKNYLMHTKSLLSQQLKYYLTAQCFDWLPLVNSNSSETHHNGRGYADNER